MDKKTKHKDGLDRISSLPDPILSHILSFLPGKDSVRSSVLSSRWRYLFISISTLDLYDYLLDEHGKNINIDSFKNFVDRVFSHPNQVSLERFTVCDFWANDLLLDDDYSRLYNWISAALRRGVKELNIDLEVHSGLELPISLLFTCQSLVTLKLGFGSHPIHVPANLCLPNLKTLHLTHVQFDCGCSIHRLISSLQVLEHLVITECYFVDMSELNIHNLSLKRLFIDYQGTSRSDSKIYDFVIVINAPSLVYFEYFDMVGEGYTLLNMNSLGEAYINLYPMEDVDREQSASHLFQGIRNIQSLRLDIEGFDTLPRRLLYEHIILDNLVELRFEHDDDDGIWSGRWLLEFLHCVPNLKTLKMNLAGTSGGFMGLLEEVPTCLSSHLKKITIERYKETEHMFELISYFLNNAIVLEKLVLGIGALSEENGLRILKRLLMLPKKSKKCEVVIF